MAFVATPDAFLADFGKTCQIGSGSTFKGLLDQSGEAIARGMSTSIEYLLTAKTSDVSSAARGTALTVDSVNYTVRENLPMDDGVFSEVLLSKV